MQEGNSIIVSLYAFCDTMMEEGKSIVVSLYAFSDTTMKLMSHYIHIVSHTMYCTTEGPKEPPPVWLIFKKKICLIGPSQDLALLPVEAQW